MKKDISSKRKWLLPICLLLLAVAVAVGGTVAIYTSQVFQRSVVRNRDNEAIRFSSDKLYRVAPGVPAQKYYYPMSQGQQTMTFQVCNYDQTKNTVFSEKNIDYTLTVEITNGTEDFTYTVSHGINTKTVQNGGSVSFEDSLRGAKRSSNSYTVAFAKTDYNQIEVAVTVTPQDLTATKNMVLNGILIPIEYATTQGVTMKSEFTDSTRGGPDLFDAYNLSVSVSGGEGDVVISWDASMLDIDPFFVAKSGGTVIEEGNQSVLTVHMNAEDETGAYLIQFYDHGSEEHSWTAWDTLPIHVQLKETVSAE